MAPYHVAAGQAREIARGDDRHGSSFGMGIGEEMAYSLAHPSEALRVGETVRRPGAGRS